MTNAEGRRQKRRGSSILEVLFAILIATIGLLGAIVVFPVASSQARKGRLLEMASAAGRSAVHEFDARGMRRPDRWYFWNPNPTTQPTVPRFDFIGVDPGESFCIDSRFVVTNALVGANAQVFPYEWATTTPTTINNLPGNALNPAPRMTRVAFFGAPYIDRNLMTGVPTGNVPNTLAGNRLQADSVFFIHDDLAYYRPGVDELPDTVAANRNDKSIPAVQLYDSQTYKRQTRGEFSWMAMLVPKVDIYSGTSSDQYVLSVVVFHQRPAGLNISDSINAADLERVVSVNVLDGTTGGEVQLLWPGTGLAQNAVNDQVAAQRLKLKANDWILLGGIQVFPANPQPRRIHRFQWYRVSDCDDEVSHNGTQYERYATLIGQDWNTGLLNQQATLVEGVIGVYEKTIRLEYGESL